MVEAPIMYKPVHWFVIRTSPFYIIKTFIMKELNHILFEPL